MRENLYIFLKYTDSYIGILKIFVSDLWKIVFLSDWKEAPGLSDSSDITDESEIIRSLKYPGWKEGAWLAWLSKVPVKKKWVIGKCVSPEITRFYMYG
jgi:hypothetical protein